MAIDIFLRTRIATLLAECNMDQRELAFRAGLSETTISGLLNGRIKDTKLSTIESIAKVLGCTVEIYLESC